MLVPFLDEPNYTPDGETEAFSEYLGFWDDQPSCMLRRGPWKMIYFSEFESYQLFNLDDDPGELIDQAGNPEYGAIAQSLVDAITQRWSGQAMLHENQLTYQTRHLLKDCNHPVIPHEFQHFQAGEDDNQFDFEQLPSKPDLDSILR